MVEPIRAAFRKELERTTFHKPAIPFISNVTGTFIQETEACSPDYWVRHMREPVYFSQGLQTILSQGSEAVFVELGAGRSLISLLKQQADAGTPAVNLVRTAKEKEDDLRYLTEGIGLLWSRGITIDWNNYYTGQHRYKLSLPAYSFEPVKYPVEVDPFKGNLLAGLGLQDNSANTGLKDWVYHPSWKRVTAAGETRKTPGRRRYLFFSGDKAFSTSLTEQLLSGETGHEVTEVLIGEEYRQLGANRYTLDPGNPGHYDQLLTALTASEIPVSDIIYSWGIDVRGEALALEKDNPALNRVYFGLGYLVRSLLQTGLLKEKRIAVLTEGLYKVMGTEEGRYAQSLLLGLVNVLPQEYSVTCFNIDLPPEGNIRTSLLAEEIRNNNGRQDRIVALRNDRRWIPDYQKNTAPIEKGADKIRPGGNYLVTGGLGKVGFVLGNYLLQQYGVRLVLTGRKEFNQLKEEALHHYNTLCGISREVYYFPGDISDTTEWEQTVARIEQQFGRIDGVIHTAGITDDHYFEPIGDLTVEKTLAMLAPKVNGIENLYRVFRDRKPDFVWITSSLSTVLGGLGFSAYSSANLYMDHFLWSKTDELPGWRSIGLGGLAFTTEDMRKEGGPTRFSLRGEELAALFDWSLALKDSPVLIQSVEDLSVRTRRVYEVKKDAYLDDDKDEFKQVWVERPPLSSLHKAPGTATEKGLTALYEAFFGIADIGIDDNFFELGGDSLKAMKLLKRIKHEFDTPITLTTFLANTTIRQIAAKLDEQLWLAADVKMDNEMLI
jgi:polyketide synthase PksN